MPLVDGKWSLEGNSLEEDWLAYWRAFYDNDEDRKGINATLVAIKRALRAQGVTAQRPDESIARAALP
tara:strand:+ start:172 stop:375 length:204 start_codon:yes stop_codon:yes gene_type:complete